MAQRFARTLPRLRALLGFAVLALVLVGVGREVTTGNASYFFVLLVAGVGLTLAVRRRGIFTALMLLLALDGVPFYESASFVFSHVTGQDVGCLGLIAASACWSLADRSKGLAPSRTARRLALCGALLLGWCTYVVLRTVFDTGTPALGALRFGHDFIYFGALLLFLPRVRFSDRELREGAAVLGGGLVLFSIGQILTVEGIANPTFIVHASGKATELGLTRLYAEMNELLFVGVAIAVAAVALGPRGARWRRWAIPVTVLLIVSQILQLTRARWITLVMAIVIVSLYFALQADRRVAALVRRRLTAGFTLAFVLGGALIATGVVSAGPLAQRLLSIFSNTAASNATLTTRQQVAHEMLLVIGHRWPTGVGLIPPAIHYYLAFPGGSLRDPDLGVLNAVVTIGAVGAALIYLPILLTLGHCLARTRRRAAPERQWINYGGQIFLVAAVASSITLVTLFSIGGLAITAALIAVLVQPPPVEAPVGATEPAPAWEPRRREYWPVSLGPAH